MISATIQTDRAAKFILERGVRIGDELEKEMTEISVDLQTYVKREKLSDFEVVWVDDQNQLEMTDGMKGVLRVLKPPTPGP